jgi:hypothetical protein
VTAYYESFDGSAPDLSWSALRDNFPWTINGDGTATIANSGGNTYQRMNGDLGSVDHYSEVLLPRTWANNANGDPRAVLLLRADPSALTYYAASLQLTNNLLSFLYWQGGALPDGGPFGAIANQSVDLSGDGPLRYRFEVEGTTFRAYLNDVLVKTEADTRRTTGTLGGTGVQRGTTIKFAEFRAAALADPAPGRMMIGA